MDDKFFIAWYGCSDFGDYSPIFNNRKEADTWLTQKGLEENILTSAVEGFDSKADAELYRDNGKRRK